ncbi:FAD-dependent oxidoreductase [Mangrovicoccus algicola]|uniref:FAD-dependent oxidoreductase n=1 Tax=Mangrovicoccus algicola TaxID=2771008 RepID=A0A8J6Z233_9RHOB|nr:FAD-dependent oxidoreductase [Mangrovicoccus algicola]MBE3640206.1 FAD-dependent oxidoreductase [Mangrovicoccus algicola]
MSWHPGIPAAEVHDRGAVAVEADGLRLALFSLEGEIFATGNICTHAFALLTEGHVENGCVECPLHQGLFDIRTGRAQGTPVTKDLATYATRIEDGMVWIDTEPKAPAAAEAPASAGAGRHGDGPRLVIIGAGQAGAETARALRAEGFAGPVTLIGEEAHPPYERPPLSKDLLLGRGRLEDAHVFEPGEAERLGIEMRLDTRVAALDPAARRLDLAQGGVLDYDLLVLATGAAARRIALPGAAAGQVHYLRDAADAARLAPALAAASRVAVIGGGFIGLEIASAARALGKAAAVIEAQDRLLTRLLPQEPGTFLAWVAQQNDVALHLGAGVAAIAPDGVRLSDGTLVEADLILAGIGAVPNDALARQAGLPLGTAGGILVNAQNRTADPAIYAVGDVAVQLDEVTGAQARSESWQNARLSAARAARAVTGHAQEAPETLWFWSDLFGGTLQIAGTPAPGQVTIRRDGAAPAFFCLDAQDRVAACIDFGDPELLRLGRRLIASGQPVDPARLADPETDLSLIEDDEMKMLPVEKRYVWPASGLDRVPDWVYTSREIYDREIERIFHGPTWNYVGLAAEVPEAGDYIRSNVGPTPVVMVRDQEGGINVFENRCSHRAAEFCRELRGNAEEFVCPYHQWSYDLKGDLAGVPFRRGVNGQGGMGPDFRPENHGVRKLKVTQRNGAVFASFSDDVESFEDYMGEEMLTDFDTVFSGRKLRVLGHYRHTLMGNWKLYPENLKDPYHATLLHTFLVTFGLLVAGNKSAMIVDPRGRHSTMASAKSDGATVSDENKAEMRAYRDGMVLEDPRLMTFFEEFDSPWSVTMQVVWPGLIVQREMNTLGVRQIVPNGPNEFTMVWTMFGYEDDDEEMTRHRLRQGNLMGPAGFLGLEDNEAIKFVQDGMLNSTGGEHLVALDPKVPAGTSNTLISEAAIRAMYRHWRQEMGL